jgi:hypothetical protein
MRNQNKLYGTPDEVCELTGLNARTLANQRSKREGIPYRKVGRKVLYPISDVEKFIEKQPVLTKDSIEREQR